MLLDILHGIHGTQFYHSATTYITRMCSGIRAAYTDKRLGTGCVCVYRYGRIVQSNLCVCVCVFRINVTNVKSRWQTEITLNTQARNDNVEYKSQW